jgi:hypothetical protein
MGVSLTTDEILEMAEEIESEAARFFQRAAVASKSELLRRQ